MTIQANQGFGVSVFGAVSGGGGGGGGGTPGGLDTQIQFNSSGSFGASAALTFVSPALTIGTQQTTQGQIVFANTAAGAFATTVQSSNSASAAWTLTLPATAGTANYALTTNGSGVSSWSQISLTAGVTGALPLANGGTNANLTASNGGIVYSGATAFAVLSGTATAGQMLRSGASGAPSWSTATFPSTATSTGTLLRADGTNWVATTATYPNTAGASGTVLQSDGTNWGNSTATFPSTATSTGTILRADGANWVATTATYPTTTTANQILYSSATNTVGGLTSANTSALVTNSSGVPSFTSGGTANRVLRTDGTTVSFAQVGLTTDVTGTLPVGNGGTGTSTTFTTGSVVFAGASGVYSQNNSKLFWDNTNNRLAVGFTSPLASLDIVGSNWTRGGASAGGVLILSSDASSGANGSTIESSFLSGGYGPLIVKTNGAESLRIDISGNILLGTSSSPTTGKQCLTIETDTAPTASPANTITLYSTALSTGNTMLSLYTEGTVVNANTTAAATHRIAIRVNGTVYYLLANTAA